jgi:hypothetical protein
MPRYIAHDQQLFEVFMSGFAHAADAVSRWAYRFIDVI